MKRQILFMLLTSCLPLLQAKAQHYNSIKTVIPSVETSTTSGLTVNNSITSYQYFDGLGRPLQNIQVGVTPGQYDLVDYQEYDALGRKSLFWLPVSLTATNNGKPVALSTVQLRSAALYSDSKAYSKPVYENSPLNRISEQYGPGQNWQNNGKSVKTEYLTNSATGELACRWYRTTDTRNDIQVNILSVAGSINYPEGELYVTRTTDEDGKDVRLEFKNKQEQTLLVRQKNGTVFHDTYYLYDMYGNLRAVLPPLAADALSVAGTWTLSSGGTDALSRYSYLYKYDNRNRLIRKKLPGAGWVRYEYDRCDRLTATQDAVQAAQSPATCTFHLYDDYNRLVVQGTCEFYGSITVLGSTMMSTNLSYTANGFVNPTGIGNSGYSSGITLYSPVPHTVNYYDDYKFLKLTGFTNANFTTPASQNSGKGLLTGKVTTLMDGSNKKLYTVFYYDEKGRQNKIVSSNHLGGYDITTTTYTFTGKPNTVTHVHTATGKVQQTQVYTYSYDHAQRLKTVTHKLNTGTTVTLVNNSYDDLGRLSSKSLHGSSSDSLAYTYNVRSWLTGITGTKFTQNLYYADGTNTTKCYNGNISSMTWKAGDESTIRGYKFSYDQLNRLSNAAYGETAAINTNPDRFTEKITGYDKNGNITALQRYGQTTATAYGLIDNLSFTLSGNQLNRVDDAVSTSAYNNSFEFKDGVKQANEYTYDLNGNLTKDLNKGITGIQYNVLNLPSVVTFSDGSTITYTYNADGIKLRTIHKIGSTTTTTDYCGNVIYENGVQKMLLTEEGYVNLTGAQQYHYYLKDHQGNNRVVINQGGQVEETNHYYPFGGVFATMGNVQPYKYNGKEYDTKNNLNWYDYGARYYDAALGRFTTVDPLAEKYYGINPYAYCLNNPIKYVDTDGKLPRIFVERKGFGHAFVTVGNGTNTTVFTYGRYGALGKDKSSARSTSPTGEGVLIKLTGNDAISFIQNQMLENEAIGYEFSNGSDKSVSEHFNKQLSESDKIPQKGKYAGNKNAKVIDEYNLFTNNCVTTSVNGIQKGVAEKLNLEDSKGPDSLDDRLKVMSEDDKNNIRQISYEDIKKEFNLHGAGTTW